jgi:hypothetical protein
MQREQFVTFFLQLVLREHYPKGLHDLAIWKPLLQLRDEKLCRTLALAFYGKDNNLEVSLPTKLLSPLT